jgi:hypothetical protein
VAQLDAPLIVYCAGAMRSVLAAESLQVLASPALGSWAAPVVA